MTALAWIIPVTLILGGMGLAAFLWALKSGQYEDLEGAAYRALEDEPPAPRKLSTPLADCQPRPADSSSAAMPTTHCNT